MLSFINDSTTLQNVALKAKELRLSENLSRKSLADKSGVTEASIKRFENTGEIAFSSLLKIANVLGNLGDFENLFAPKVIVSLKDLQPNARTRGRK